MRRLIFLVTSAIFGCGQGANEGNFSDATGPEGETIERVDAEREKAESGIDIAGQDFPVCVPGTTKGCTQDNLGLVMCNSSGTGWEAVPCGEDSACLDDSVGCTACKPGKKRCKNDEIVEICDEQGSSYKDYEDCRGAETGKICLNGACVRLCDLSQKLHSYIGCEYWGVDLDNALVPGGEQGFYDAAGAQYSIVVSNTSPKYPARVQIFTVDGEVTLDSKGNPLPLDPIPPMSLRIFNLPRRDADGTVLAPLAYRVVSSIPITAYQFNPLENVNVFSNDASILLPSHVLGKYYIVMTREQTFAELKGFLTVVAVYPGETQVAVTVTAPTLAGNGIPALKRGETLVRIMKQYDVLNIETDAYGADLTGSIVVSDRPVAVFGGSEASNAPNTNHCCPDGECGEPWEQVWLDCKEPGAKCVCEWPKKPPEGSGLLPQDVPCKHNYDCIKYNTCCADHLEMQMFPVKTWGEEYIATRSYPRKEEPDVWRILAAEDSTAITTYPIQTNLPILNRGEYVDFESYEDFEIYAKKPILVGQFLAAQDAPYPNIGGVKQPQDAGTGDPTFILAVPVEQFRTEYVFLAPDKYMFDCVNIIAPVGARVFLDGVEVGTLQLVERPIREIMKDMKEQGFEHPTQLEELMGVRFGYRRLVGSGNWEVYRLIVADGVHTATSDEPFGIISYGYDQYVSYGYPAGLNLEDLKIISEPK